MKDDFRTEYALLVRPFGDGYQVVSGHNRVKAAKTIGLQDVPCWVRDMDDDTAFMELLKANSQGELSPLEVGVHALQAVPLEQGKAGGGLAAYAHEIGRSGEYIGQMRAAASVWQSLPNLSLEVADKAKHLYEISKAPADKWPLLVTQLIDRAWTVKDTQAAVQKIKNDELAGVPNRSVN